MGKTYAGTSGWAYPAWKPEFYPAKLPAAKFLGHYAGRLNSVEVNFTFRRFPTEKLLQGWIQATPPDFQFAIKAHQRITHIKRLRDDDGFTSEFVTSLQPLAGAGKLGPVLFQLPPYLKRDVALLADFLRKWPGSVRAAFEFRHASWFAEDIFAVLREAGGRPLSRGERETGNSRCANSGFLVLAIEETRIFKERAAAPRPRARRSWRSVYLRQA